jgi:hypothetical protein
VLTATSPTFVNAPVAPATCAEKPVSLLELSVQRRSISVADLTVATRLDGAAGTSVGGGGSTTVPLG